MTQHWYARALARGDWPTRDLRRLLRRCSAGDARARETVILRFVPFARRLARRYEGRGEPIEDLCQAATVGLIKAVDRYSPDRGDAFVAYARPVILGEIRRHFRDTTWRVHVPRPMREQAGRVLRAERELTSAHGSPAKLEVIAEYLGIGLAEVTDARCALEAYWPGSLDATFAAPDGDAIALREVGAHESGYERVEMSVQLRRTLLTLKPRDRRVLLLRLACELTQDEIAGRIGLSQMQVSRILRNAGAALTTSTGLAVST